MLDRFENLVPEKIYGKKNSMASSVFNMLRSAIVTLRLLPGNSLSEAEVAKQLGVSRQPVREAFLQLSKIGLLKIIPQKGTYIIKINEHDVENARFIRESIEVALVERACSVAEKEQIDKIFRVISEQESAVAKLDQERFLLLDDAFHHAIALSADCLYGWHIVENLKAQMDRIRFLSLPEGTPITKIVHQHRLIAEAIKVGDREAGCEAMKEHLSEILKSLPDLAEKHEELFSKKSCL